MADETSTTGATPTGSAATAAGSSPVIKAGLSAILIAMAVFLVTTGNAVKAELGRVTERLNALVITSTGSLEGYEVVDRNGEVVGSFRRVAQGDMMGSGAGSCGDGACGAEGGGCGGGSAPPASPSSSSSPGTN